MGGCVSSPKDLELNEGEAAPVESPATPKATEGETVVMQETNEEAVEEKDEPLVLEAVEANADEPQTQTQTVAAIETFVAEEVQSEELKAEDTNEEPLVTL